MKKNEMGKACRTFGVRWSAYRVFVGKPDVKTQPRKHRHRRKNYFEMHFEEIVWECVTWIALVQDWDK